MQLLICDMDGVLFRGENFWFDLHCVMRTDAFALELWQSHGRSNYAALSELTARRWRGRSSRAYFAMCDNREVMPGAENLFKYCHIHGVRTAIISSGPWHLARRAQEMWGIDYIFANRLGLTADGSRFSGKVEVQVDNNSKEAVLQSLQSSLGVSSENTVVIGDTRADAKMGDLAICSIGYNVWDEVAREMFDFHASTHLGNAMPFVIRCAAAGKGKVSQLHLRQAAY